MEARNICIFAKKTFMSQKALIIRIGFVLFLLTSCGHGQKLPTGILYLSENYPDSALAIFKTININRLNEENKALYALAYTIAQDKSGLDVDNDSLLNIAYSFYNNKVKDSLYAKCQYYMGKYYMLNDSFAKAEVCLRASLTNSRGRKDNYTSTLALEKLSRVLRRTNPQQAINFAREATRIYASLPNAPKINLVYAYLNESVTMLLADSVSQAEMAVHEALKIATNLSDSMAISDSYQDMSNVFGKKGESYKALLCAKASCRFDNKNSIHKHLNLAEAYLNADSTRQCIQKLKRINTKSPSTLYTAYYLMQIAAMKEHDFDQAKVYADSSDYFMEYIYKNELSDNIKSQQALMKTEHAKWKSEVKIENQRWLILYIVILMLTIISFILYAYRQEQIKNKIILQKKKEENKMTEMLHAEAMAHKDIQISTMRNFIVKKVGVAQKIEKIKKNRDKNILLTNEDWEEIMIFVNNIEGDYLNRIKTSYPQLDEDDIRLLVLLRLKLPTKALALIYGISEKSIKQKLFIYKKKIGIDGDKQSLRKFIDAF